jgi:hypothetical protein
MNSRHQRLFGILVLLLGLIASHVALALDIVIESATPETAEQGTLALDVTIAGTGFDNTVEDVQFLLPCTPEPCTGTPGGITVTKFKVRGSKKIIANINVSADAEVANFDIAMTRGRGGKGTTFKGLNKFTVKLKPNQQLVSCDEIIEAPLGSCTCMFSWGGNENIYGLLDNCVTSETLRLKSMIRTAGSVQANGTERLSITAVLCSADNGSPGNRQDCDGENGVPTGTFSGSSVIENWFHRARVRYLDIRFDAGAFGDAPTRGCDTVNDDIQSAISFVLRADDPPDPDTDTPDPRDSLPEGNPDPINRNSFFGISEIGIYSKDDALCNGIEVIRTQGYTDKYTIDPVHGEVALPARDWKVGVANTEISPGSYGKAGIVMLGMMPMESINPPYVNSNTIGAAACEDSYPVGILLGDLTPDPVNQIEGVVESNTIDMTSDCDDTEPAGVLVIGDAGGTQTTAKVSKNDISGAYVGIEADGNVVDINFSGNTLTGDGETGSGDTGIFSDAKCTGTKGKPNKITDFDTDINDAGCP